MDRLCCRHKPAVWPGLAPDRVLVFYRAAIPSFPVVSVSCHTGSPYVSEETMAQIALKLPWTLPPVHIVNTPVVCVNAVSILFLFWCVVALGRFWRSESKRVRLLKWQPPLLLLEYSHHDMTLRNDPETPYTTLYVSLAWRFHMWSTPLVTSQAWLHWIRTSARPRRRLTGYPCPANKAC